MPGKGNAGLALTATATDACTGVATLVVTRVTCTRPELCRVVSSGATVTVFASGGIGNVLRWTVQAGDAGGNTSQQTCEVRVVKKWGGPAREQGGP